jgi:aryl-alcohol dehydrogenase-like predicted oxidoreductase
MKVAEDGYVGKLVLGTANLGMNYGITNINGFKLETSNEILNAALEHQITQFDTSPDYGDAEKILGRLNNENKTMKISTKIPVMAEYTYEKMYKSCKNSLTKLKAKKIENLLFHDPDIYKYKSLESESLKLLETGIVANIGFSAYSVEHLYQAKIKNPSWNIFQIPLSIAHRDNVMSQGLKDFAKQGNRIQARSIFLQGLLLQPPEQLKNRFPQIGEFVSQLLNLAEQSNATALDLCLNIVHQQSWINSFVVGVADVNQLEKLVNCKKVDFDADLLPFLDGNLLDPRNWI